MYLNLLGTFSILIVCCFCGFVAYAFYFDCDPLLAGKIKKYDQEKPAEISLEKKQFNKKFL